MGIIAIDPNVTLPYGVVLALQCHDWPCDVKICARGENYEFVSFQAENSSSRFGTAYISCSEIISGELSTRDLIRGAEASLERWQERASVSLSG